MANEMVTEQQGMNGMQGLEAPPTTPEQDGGDMVSISIPKDQLNMIAEGLALLLMEIDSAVSGGEAPPETEGEADPLSGFGDELNAQNARKGL